MPRRFVLIQRREFRLPTSRIPLFRYRDGVPRTGKGVEDSSSTGKTNGKEVMQGELRLDQQGSRSLVPVALLKDASRSKHLACARNRELYACRQCILPHREASSKPAFNSRLQLSPSSQTVYSAYSSRTPGVFENLPTIERHLPS